MSEGLDALANEGPPGLTIERMCARLSRTKGSFYSHFSGTSDLEQAVLAAWERRAVDEPLAAAEGSASGARAALDDAAIDVDHRLDRRVRAWAGSSDAAAVAVARVDARRLAHLAEDYTARGFPDARLRAELEYTAFVGAQTLGLFDSRDRALELAGLLRSALDAGT